MKEEQLFNIINNTWDSANGFTLQELSKLPKEISVFKFTNNSVKFTYQNKTYFCLYEPEVNGWSFGEIY